MPEVSGTCPRCQRTMGHSCPRCGYPRKEDSRKEEEKAADKARVEHGGVHEE
ncbi:MAG: hypothetical protein ABIH38_05650 [Patescibacteria group bacterium]